MVDKSKRRTKNGSRIRPEIGSAAHDRVRLLQNDKLNEWDWRKLQQSILAYDEATRVMGVARHCDLAPCRRHRVCTFDYACPTLPPADDEARFVMEHIGLPLCLAQHADAFVQLVEFSRAMKDASVKRQR